MGGMGAEAAIEAADVVILNDSPAKVPELLTVAGQVRRVAWQNIALALGVKGLVMIFGVAGLSGLWEAVFADVGVALLAVLNAVRGTRH
jgi:Cd2+/Zn2+-exporting ATPase